MRLFYILLLISITFGCTNNTKSFEEECPYDFAFNIHYLKVPIVVSPHSMNYSVGDTITFTSEYSDSIEDVGAQENFLIRDFPFEPVSNLFRFHDDEFSFDSGFTVNTHQVDSIYNPIFFDSSDRVDWFRAITTYENGIYKFEHNIILDKPGRYIMLTTDLFMERESSGSAELNDPIRAIEFAGKCNRIPLGIVSVIEGADHMEEFMEELLFLDDNVYRGKLISVDQGSTGPLKAGNLKLEFYGLFCFEVTE